MAPGRRPALEVRPCSQPCGRRRGGSRTARAAARQAAAAAAVVTDRQALDVCILHILPVAAAVAEMQTRSAAARQAPPAAAGRLLGARASEGGGFDGSARGHGGGCDSSGCAQAEVGVLQLDHTIVACIVDCATWVAIAF